jgi:hypothetical protein
MLRDGMMLVGLVLLWAGLWGIDPYLAPLIIGALLIILAILGAILNAGRPNQPTAATRGPQGAPLRAAKKNYASRLRR